MKQTILTIIIGMVTIHSFAQKRPFKPNEERSRIRRGKSVSNDAKTNTANVLYQQLLTCPAQNGCGLQDDYCNTAKCGEVIASCHKITIGQFNILTNSGNDGHAVFTNQQLSSVLSGATCNVVWTRCYIHHGWFTTYYRMGQVTGYSPSGLEAETYYSQRLLQYIYDRGVESITLYKGTLTAENKLIIPFKIKYQNPDMPDEYYDVSDTQP